MATCSVCGVNCRGSCKRCGARLCHEHMPKSGRAKCAVCPQSTRASRSTPVTSYYTPSHAPRNLAELSASELLTYMHDLHQRLEAKKTRERAYLDRRATRGAHTPTDDAYEADQVLETEILAMIDYIIGEVMQP